MNDPHSNLLAGKTTEKPTQIILQAASVLPLYTPHIGRKQVLKQHSDFEHMLEELKHLRNICTSAKASEREKSIDYSEL